MPPEWCHQKHAAAILDNRFNHQVDQCPRVVGIENGVRSPPDIKRIVSIRVIVTGVCRIVQRQLVMCLTDKEVYLRVNAKVLAHGLKDDGAQNHILPPQELWVLRELALQHVEQWIRSRGSPLEEDCVSSVVLHFTKAHYQFIAPTLELNPVALLVGVSVASGEW